MTSGFLGYTYDRNTRDEGDEGDEDDDEDDVLFHLKECAMLSMHPMLLPAVILKSWCNYYHERLDNSRWLLRRVEEQSREMEKMNLAIQNSELVIKLRYHENHEIIDQEYKFLWSENFHFVKDLSASCLQALGIIKSFKEEMGEEEMRKDEMRGDETRNDETRNDDWIGREINGHLLHLDSTVSAYEQRRQRMLKRMEITIDEVC